MFCNLHVHDAKGSLLDSILTVKQIAEFARDNNQEAIAITNHGYMTSYVDFVKECNRCGIKPIIGNEVYEVDDMGEKCDTKEYRQPRYHLVLLARSQQGFQNLIKITSVACTEGLYKKPRIDIDYIQTHNLGKGIICLTACMAGRLSRLLVDNKIEEALAYYTKLSDTFDSVYCELQSHNTESQAFANKCIYDFCKNNELSYVITTDAHMLSKDMLEAHSYFIEIAEDREVGESYTDCYLQTETDVYNTLKDQFSEQIIQTGIENTYAIANSIENINIGLGQGNQMPVVKVDGDFKSHEEYLRHLVFSTFDEKFGHMSEDEQKVRRGRLDFELDVLYKVEYTDYFIMLYMLAKEARKRHIPLGYSRGSGANCLCLFMLNVTQVDSVRWGLDFSRFANLGRTSLADYDWDISKRRRKEMVKISEELFGKDNVAPIATFNTLSTKVAIRDIGKVLNEKETSPYFGQIPYSLRNEVASALPTIKTLDDLGEEVEKEILLKDYVSKDERLQRVYEQFPLWFKYVMAVEGLPKSLGRHAAGTLITPKPITDYCPICFDSEKNVMIQLEMHNAMDDLGLVKMDYLGLENLDIIDDTLKLCNLTWQDVDINHLDLADKEVFDNVYKQGHTIGIFQMESAEARKMCIEAQADNIDDIIAINAANRPATKDSFPTYCENKLHPENVKLIHEDLRQFFSNTQYILLYQEQALQLFRYAGFPESEVDNARRCVDENTLVTMSNGDIKKIKDINVGDNVMCYDEVNNKMTYKPVVNVFDNGEKECFRISTKQDEEIIATADHKVLTQDGWKEVKDLTLNDYIMKPKTYHAYKDNIPSNKKPSNDLMYLIGLLIGDGTLGDKNSIKFTNSEHELIIKFKSIVEAMLPHSHNCEFYERKVDGVEVDYIYTVSIKTPNFKHKLENVCEKYDLFHKANSKNISCFMDYPASGLIQHLLAGLFNTDGGYCMSRNAIEYHTISETLAYQISALLLKFRINNYVLSKTVSEYDYKVYSVEIQNTTSLERFGRYINKYVIGRKQQEFSAMITASKLKKESLDYLYILPNKYSSEIRNNIALNGISYCELSKDIYNGEQELKVVNGCGITDKKASAIVSQVYCPETYKMLTAEYYPVKIKLIKPAGVKHVYDIEVSECHNYVANNLIVHNCIGKKLADKMAQLQTDFTKGLANKNWTEEQINSIWDLLLKQSTYSFNKGHSTAYGLLSYLTAYLKTHYPVEFMTALLTSRSDKIEKISATIDDCRRMNIQVCPPNVNKSDGQFTVVPNENKILFGLLGIKGLGESVVDEIIKNRPYKNFDDFTSKITNTSAIVTLIKAGAIPTKNKMSLLRKYAEKINPISEYSPVSALPTYKKLEEMGIDVDSFREGKKVDKERLLVKYNAIRKKAYYEQQNIKHHKAINEFRKKYAQDEFLWEFQTLSMFLSNDPLLESKQYISSQWQTAEAGSLVLICCVITDIKKKKDKNGNQFAYLDLYTSDGMVEATIWSSQLKKYTDIVKKSSCVIIKARKNDGYFVDEMKLYSQWLNERKLKK